MDSRNLNARLVDALRPFVRRLPLAWRMRLRRWWHATQAPRIVAPSSNEANSEANEAYAKRVQQEVTRFAEEEVVHDLPRIFHYWANQYLLAQFKSFGFSSPEDFYARQIEKHIAATGKPARIVSVGAGNCDTEALVAQLLRERGVQDFVIECLDITDAMLERGAALARDKGLERHLRFVRADFNHWQPDGHYDVVMANQSLHHVTNLEGLFDAVRQAIGDDGIFITSDMIGRNGHQRWPEALAIVQEFWTELPAKYRYNVQLRRQEDTFLDWDCAVEGFEGVRAQDILPLLLERFGFDLFFAFGNLIDPFIDRSFGPHFDPEDDFDRTFIDRVQARDEAEIEAGNIKPTHLLAVMRRDRGAKPATWKGLTPEHCLRRPG